MGENAQVRYSEVCVISEKDQMMKTKHGGTKYVRYSEGYTIVHVCDTEVKLYWGITFGIVHDNLTRGVPQMLQFESLWTTPSERSPFRNWVRTQDVCYRLLQLCKYIPNTIVMLLFITQVIACLTPRDVPTPFVFKLS